MATVGARRGRHKFRTAGLKNGILFANTHSAHWHLNEISESVSRILASLHCFVLRISINSSSNSNSICLVFLTLLWSLPPSACLIGWMVTHTHLSGRLCWAHILYASICIIQNNTKKGCCAAIVPKQIAECGKTDFVWFCVVCCRGLGGDAVTVWWILHTGMDLEAVYTSCRKLTSQIASQKNSTYYCK